ncbi:MAG: methionine adenosyltransferase domain-containing protein [Pseudomonadota bacterium]
MRNFVLTSEAVAAGHPDKLCDQISDAVVDASLMDDPMAGCVAECALASGIAFLSVRHGREPGFDPAAITRRVLEAETGAPGAPATVMLDMVRLPELAGPSAEADRMTTAFGYACDHGADLMPRPLMAAHRLRERLEAASRGAFSDWLSPDGVAQVAMRFADRRPQAVEAAALGVFVAKDGPEGADLEAALRREVLDPALEAGDIPASRELRLVVQRQPGAGGPRAHAGLTGRKMSSDTYGGFSRHSSSALSGKDPSRVDRIAAYAARQAAVSVVAAGLAAECEVQLSWVPGDEAPVTVEIDTFDSAVEPESEIAARLARSVDFRLGAVIERLDLHGLPALHDGVFYRLLARGPHFGRPELDLPWDRPLTLR